MKENYYFNTDSEIIFTPTIQEPQSQIIHPELKEIIQFLPAKIVKAEFVDPEVIIPEIIYENENGFSWEIESRRIFNSNGREIKGYKQIIRNDNLMSLNICKDSYHPITNRYFSESAYLLSELTGFKIEKFTELKAGGMVQCWLKAEPFRVNGHEYHSYMVIGNSHTGNAPFYIGEYTSMTRCNNQFTHVQQDMTAIHRSLIDTNIQNILRLFNVYINMKQNTINLISKLHGIPLNLKEVKSIVDKIFKID